MTGTAWHFGNLWLALIRGRHFFFALRYCRITGRPLSTYDHFNLYALMIHSWLFCFHLEISQPVTLESNNNLTSLLQLHVLYEKKGCCVITYDTGLLLFLFADKPEVRIVVTYPEGLTREGDNLDLTCIAEGKPQ